MTQLPWQGTGSICKDRIWSLGSVSFIQMYIIRYDWERDILERKKMTGLCYLRASYRLGLWFFYNFPNKSIFCPFVFNVSLFAFYICFLKLHYKWNDSIIKFVRIIIWSMQQWEYLLQWGRNLVLHITIRWIGHHSIKVLRNGELRWKLKLSNQEMVLILNPY